ncbi:EamA family transporter [Candidatus Woesearchaeota archaeon]|nr:EamA family transporter [Candidatus Woesearchaeota archaeon]
MINILAIILIVFGTVIGSCGTLLFKKGVDKLRFRELFFSKFLWGGLVLYGFSVIFYVTALRMGELSVVYPFASTAYIWTTLFSVMFLGEKMNKWKLISVGGIIMGVILIGVGS